MTLDYKDTELSIRIEMKRLFGRKEEFLYELMKLFKEFDLDDEKLDCEMILDERRPYDEDIMYRIGESYRIKGNISEMEKWYNKVREITTEHDFRLLLRLGEALVFGSTNSKMIKKGIGYLETAHMLELENKDVLYALVEGCMKIHNSEYELKARRYCEKYLEIDPDDEDIQKYLEDLSS